LIFVSLAKRYARIIVGTEIAARVLQGRWQAAVDALIAHMRNGLIADGLLPPLKCAGRSWPSTFPPALQIATSFPIGFI
jgi:putative membrane protein